jgi:iron complex outermembrane recepter protein
LDYTVGLYTFEETGTETVTIIGLNGLQVTMGSAGNVFQSIVRDIDNTSDAFYGQMTYHFDAPLHLTLGIRSTDDTKSFDVTQHRDFCNVPGNTANGDGVVNHDKVTDVCGSATGSASFKETDPMITLAYDITDTAMLYGTFSTGFRDGGFASRFPDGLPNPVPAFKPEYVESFEVGVKASFADGRFQVNTALFFTDYEDMQVTGAPADPMFGGTGVNNVGSASLDGLELEAFWSITDNFRADFTVGLLDAQIEQLAGGSLQAGDFTVFPSDQLPYTPETNYTVGLTWRAALGNGSNITTRLDWIHTDSMRFRLEPHPDMSHPAYDRANLSATFNPASQAWALTFGARNLTDELYSTAGQFGADNAVSARNVSRPRQLYARFQYWLGQ